MRKTILSVALMVLIGSSGAFAQGDRHRFRKIRARRSIEAPVGHRQPRVGDVPNEKNLNDPNDPLSKENAALDKKIKSICRGC